LKKFVEFEKFFNKVQRRLQNEKKIFTLGTMMLEVGIPSWMKILFYPESIFDIFIVEFFNQFSCFSLILPR